MKDSYDYEVKAKARAMLKSTIQTIYPKPAARRTLKVLTLLGHQNLELEQIWDPLGVPRQNITNIEYDQKAYETSPKDRGTKNVFGNLEDVIKTLPESFDIINLDMVSPFNVHQRDILRAISFRQLLGEKGILATWYLGQRENRLAKKWFLFNKEKYVSQKTEGEGLVERGDLISRMINCIMLDGYLNFIPHWICNDEIIGKKYEEFSREHLAKEWGIDPSGEDFEQRYEIAQPIHANRAQLFMGPVIKEFIESTPSLKLLSDNSKRIYQDILLYQKIGSYFSMMQKRFRYIGNKKSVMVGDISYYKQLPLDTIVEIQKFGSDFKILDHRHSSLVKEQNRLFQQFIVSRRRCWENGQEIRVNLGSSYTPKSREPLVEKVNKEDLTKEEAIYLLREGVPIEEILETYSGLTKM